MKKLLSLLIIATTLLAASSAQDVQRIRKRAATAAPCTSAVIDNFNRTDEGPPMTNWGLVNELFGSNTRGLKVVSNQAENTFGGVHADYRSATTYGPNAEVYVTIVAMGGGADTSGVMIGLGDPTGTPTGYSLLASKNTSTLTVYRIDGDSNHTVLGATMSQTITDGDSPCLRREGNDLNVYYKVGAGSWTFVGTRTDATYTSAGYFGLWADGGSVGSAKLDNLGGGTL